MYKFEPEVEIVADSATKDSRLITYKLKYWRPILPEMNTHRVFSRNAASSRARSFASRAEEAVNNTWVPAYWNAEQKGMVGGEEFEPDLKEYLNRQIQLLAQDVVDRLTVINNEVINQTGKGIHKQYLNRYLEPFLPVTQLVSSTDWGNFFKLRCALDAQPEMRYLAIKMRTAFYNSVPTDLNYGEYHIPFVTQEERDTLDKKNLFLISAARCARVSYTDSMNTQDYSKDLALAKRLLINGHMSPFEHIARAEKGTFANFVGFNSLRNHVEEYYSNILSERMFR